MLRENLRIFKKLVYIADLCLVALGFQLAVIVKNLLNPIPIGLFSYDAFYIIALFSWAVVLWQSPNCYVFRLRKVTEIITSSAKASLLASAIFIAGVFILGYHVQNRLLIVGSLLLSSGLLVVIRMAIVSLLFYYRSKGFNYQTVLIIGTGTIAKNFADKIFNNVQFGLKIIGFIDWEKRAGLWRYRDIPCIGYLDDLPDILRNKQVDFVVYAVGKKYLGTIEKSLMICEQMGVRTSVLADFFPLKLARRRIESFFGSPMICYDSVPGLNFSMILKSLFDPIMATIGLILASPVMLAAAIAIKITSHGPVIFAQTRCGLNGRQFKLFKFRTMVADAELLKKALMRFNEIDGAAFKMTNDPRITPVGKLLRKTSIDELPQLFNILRGDMSFVGPRPPLADEVAHYDLWQRRKLSMKPGLTCLWQVSGRSDVSFEQWMKLDLEYIDHWSLLKDAEILARTVPAVLKGTGAR
jgi:exopolysaccharide biosynthesis polyprenyl glycosylphosphotransferase